MSFNTAERTAREDQKRAATIAHIEANAAKLSQGGGAESRPYSDIEAEKIRWLWPGRVARGKVTAFGGNPGLGKSQITLSLAAIVSNGGMWPVDKVKSEIGSVLILSLEDDAGDTIRPRLEAAGADLSRCHSFDGIRTESGALRLFNLVTDIAALDTKLTELGDCALLIIDPISAVMGGTDSHRNSDVRELIAPLAALAAKHDVAVVLITHLNKTGGTEATMRFIGSIGLVAASRGGWLAIKDSEDPDRRLFLPAKNNLGPDSAGLSYTLESVALPSGITACRVVWGTEAVTMTASDALCQDADEEGSEALREAADWLRVVLKNGPMSKAEVVAHAKDKNIAIRTLGRARKLARVISERSGFGEGSQWRLIDAIQAKPVPTKNHGPNGDVGPNGVAIGVPHRDETALPHSGQGIEVGTDGDNGIDAPFVPFPDPLAAPAKVYDL